MTSPITDVFRSVAMRPFPFIHRCMEPLPQGSKQRKGTVVKRRIIGVVGATALVAALAGTAFGIWLPFDIGLRQQNQLYDLSGPLYGVRGALKHSSTESVSQAQADAEPRSLITLADSLHARVVTSGVAGADIDMMAFYPNAFHPKWLIACNEGGPDQPGLQRINIQTGEVATIVTGTSACDPVHATPWGTYVFGEEEDDGHLYELIDPLDTTDVVLDRATGTTSGGTGAENIVRRDALGFLAFEGIGVLPSGVVYYGDENRPFEGAPGGAYYKFIPASPWVGGDVSSLDESPLIDGDVYGLRLGKREASGGTEPDPGTDYGQGMNFGLGTWIAMDSDDLRAEAAAKSLTGYYRPEDLAFDGKAFKQGTIRFCGPNTGNEGENHYFGETICVTDGTFAEALENSATPELQQFVVGNPEQAMMDNIAYQPNKGNWLINEDGAGPDVGRNNDIWDCLRDGRDDDLLSDGCVRVATLNDLTAETTGGVFTASGKRYFVSIQHNVTGFGVVLEITGWTTFGPGAH